MLQIEKAKAEVFAMPTDEVPALFRSLQEESSSSDVEIIGEIVPAKRAKVQTITL